MEYILRNIMVELIPDMKAIGNESGVTNVKELDIYTYEGMDVQDLKITIDDSMTSDILQEKLKELYAKAGDSYLSENSGTLVYQMKRDIDDMKTREIQLLDELKKKQAQEQRRSID